MSDVIIQYKDLKSFEVVFTGQDGKPHKLYCSLKSIEPTTLVIDSNNRNNNDLYACTGDALDVSIYTENGVYTASSKVISTESGLINTEYVIEYPYDTKYFQRREYFRAELAIEFTMKILLDPVKQDVWVVDSHTRNISGKGMSFMMNMQLPEYEMIYLELFFPEKTIHTAARLVYSKPVFVSHQPKFIHAFNFLNITDKDTDFIIKKCFLYQIEMRKKYMT